MRQDFERYQARINSAALRFGRELKRIERHEFDTLLSANPELSQRIDLVMHELHIAGGKLSARREIDDMLRDDEVPDNDAPEPHYSDVEPIMAMLEALRTDGLQIQFRDDFAINDHSDSTFFTSKGTYRGVLASDRFYASGLVLIDHLISDLESRGHSADALTQATKQLCLLVCEEINSYRQVNRAYEQYCTEYANGVGVGNANGRG